MKFVNFTDKVFTFTQKNALFSAPSHLLVAVSGGPDSMALLHTLAHWPQPGLHLSAVHLNHGLRGEAAQRDEDFVRGYCTEHSIPLTVYREDVGRFAKEHNLTLEEAGREIRYLRFEQLRQEIGADWIVTAHTASDQSETMLMHLVRGCGLDALQGIPVKRNYVCRPLLACNREEILSYCNTNKVPYVLDETNLDMQFTRNRMRHQVLPLLREINPAVDASLLRFQNHIAEDVALLDELSRQLLDHATKGEVLCIQPLREAAGALRRRAIRLLLRQHQLKSVEETHIRAVEHLILSGTGKALLPDKHVVLVHDGALTMTKLAEPAPEKPVAIPITVLPTTLTFNNQQYTISLLPVSDAAKVHNLFANSAIDYDTIQGGLCLRPRQTGDTLHLAGRGIHKSLKKLMNEWKIPAQKRDGYPLLCDDTGVLLIPGYACDQRAVITPETKRLLVIRVQ